MSRTAMHALQPPATPETRRRDARSAPSSSSSSSAPSSRRIKPYRLIGAALAITYALALPLLASAASSPSSQSLSMRAARRDLISMRHQRSLASRFLHTVRYRLEFGGDALPRASFSSPPASLQPLFARQDDNSAAPATDDEVDNSHGPDSDQPIMVGNTAFSPLILLFAGMAFSIACFLFVLIMMRCSNSTETKTGRDRLRAQHDLRLRGAGRRSAAEPYVFSSRAPSGISTPTGNRTSTRIDRRPPPRPGMSVSPSSRAHLYASHLSQASGSVAGSDHPLIMSASGPGRAGVNSFLSTSSGPFGDSQTALAFAESSRQAQQRPAGLPMPPMRQMSWDIVPGTPRKSLLETGRASPGLPPTPGRPRKSSDLGAKTSRSSTIGKGTDLYRNRGSRAFVPAVNPSAVAPAAMPTGWRVDRDHYRDHPLDGSSELKRHLTDPVGSLDASRRNSMLSLSVGSGSNDSGVASPNQLPLLGGGGGVGGLVGAHAAGGGGGGASPDSATSSSHLSTFSNGLTTGPLLPLGSSYLSAAGGANNVPTGDLVGTGYFGTTSHSTRGGGGGAGGRGTSNSGGYGYERELPPPVPLQKSVYHGRPAAGPGSGRGGHTGRNALVHERGPSPVAGGLASRGPGPAGPRSGRIAQQRYDDDLEAAGAGVQSGLLAGRERLPGARAGMYGRRPGGPR